MTLFNLDAHDEAATLHGLKKVLASMRWQDVELFADALEDARSGGQAKSARKLTAAMVNDWSPHDTIRNRMVARDAACSRPRMEG